MISKDEVRHVGKLARLNLSEEEVKELAEQLGNILESFSRLDELDTEGVEPTAYTVPMSNVFRDDKVQKSLDRETALKNAPDKRDGQFRVPPISAD